MPTITRKTEGQKCRDQIKRLKKLPKWKTVHYQDKELRIKEALKAYWDDAEPEIKSLRVAAGVFDLSYSTLYDRSKGGKPLSENGGHNNLLTEAQEASLIWYMDAAIERGFPLRYDMITAAAAKILKLADSKKVVGINWSRRWVEKMDKLGRYHALKTTPMDFHRKDAMTVEAIQEYFAKMDACFKKYGIELCDIYNVDEIGFRIGCISSTTVITHKNIKQVRNITCLMYANVLTMLGLHKRPC